ncbi:protein disulfide-isomerase TMX3 isoform X2 [Tribolium madens]|uniref:protein disulfide-isomerase TMX3 isoform X2 n=1 Tax=Tribolium madens TaxID=41895 RepID=UPI001CF734BE|nr:protein disulfide-isomerase TMX3 isoform X2 [Tribolium madens]
MYTNLTIFCAILVCCSASRVLELSDKFSEIYKEGGFWLVKFYAPWCGHCKRLEPVWAQVAQALYKTNIRVGRVDCTRFPTLATEFSVNGFPTIKFIKPGEDFTFHGDRTKDDIVNFAIRMAGPPVQDVTRSESLTNLKQMNQLFFMYVGEQEGLLWEAYYDVASKLQPHGFFYSASKEIAKQHVDIDELPAVFVYKESLHYFYPIESGPVVDLNESEEAQHLNSSMYKWINEERFETFPKITRENKLQQISQEMLEFRDMVEGLIRKKRDKYHKYFQFGWVGNPELANSIAMQVLPLPHLLVLNSTTNHHHIPEDDPSQLTSDAIDIFLERIYNQSVPAYGGNSLAVRLYRTYFEARTSLADMWRGNPVLTTVLFGLPLGFLSLILYSICCSDILDADEDEEEELLHEKKE